MERTVSREEIDQIYDPKTLYEENFEAIDRWIRELWHYTHELNQKRTPGLGNFAEIEKDMRRICQDNGFPLVRNDVTSDEDMIYTLDVRFRHGLHQLVEMSTDMVDMQETEIELDAMTDHLAECRIMGRMPAPSSWARKAAHHLAMARHQDKGLIIRAMDPTATAVLDAKRPGWRTDDEDLSEIDASMMRIPAGRTEIEIRTQAGIGTLWIRDHDRDITWSDGELSMPRSMINRSLVTGSVGRPVSAICEFPGFGHGAPIVLEAGFVEGRARFTTDALDVDMLEIITE